MYSARALTPSAVIRCKLARFRFGSDGRCSMVALGRLSYFADELFFRQHSDGFGRAPGCRRAPRIAELRVTLAANYD